MRSNHPWCAIPVLMCLAAIGQPALAAEVSRAPFQDYIEHNCGNGSVCAFNFPSVPARRRQEVRNVSCLITAPDTTTELAIVQLIVQKPDHDIVARSTLVPQPLSHADGIGRWAANQEVFIFAAARQNFQINAVAIGDFNRVACHIGGDLVVLER